MHEASVLGGRNQSEESTRRGKKWEKRPAFGEEVE